jgi:hypothetical protein
LTLTCTHAIGVPIRNSGFYAVTFTFRQPGKQGKKPRHPQINLISLTLSGPALLYPL